MKSMLMSIQSKWLFEILNGEKIVELRKRFLIYYRGWVYLYCTKGKQNLYLPYEFDCFMNDEASKPYISKEPILDVDYLCNGKVVGRVWVDKVDTYYVESNMIWLLNDEDNRVATSNKIEQDILRKSCVNLEDFKKYAKPINDERKRLFAIHFSKLEIFDKPKELNEFYYSVYYGMDCPPYFKEVKKQVRKAPQSWQYIYFDEAK